MVRKELLLLACMHVCSLALFYAWYHASWWMIWSTREKLGTRKMSLHLKVHLNWACGPPGQQFSRDRADSQQIMYWLPKSYSDQRETGSRPQTFIYQSRLITAVCAVLHGRIPLLCQKMPFPGGLIWFHFHLQSGHQERKQWQLAHSFRAFWHGFWGQNAGKTITQWTT